ncbi:unnamed protein product, partial [marine sediment metagenome]
VSTTGDIEITTTGELNVEAIVPESVGASNFLELSDTPVAYTGHTLKVLQVTSGENSLEFTSTPTLTGTNFTNVPDGALTETYLRADGTIALAGEWDMGSQALTNVNIDSGDIANAVTNTEWDAAYTHVSSDGSDHSFINQSVVSGASPTFDGTNFTGIPDGSLDETYLRADGTIALAGAWDMGSQILTNVNIDSGVITGITDLLVADGGTGVSTFADGGLLVGAGAGAIEALGVGLTTQLLVGGGAGVNPAWGTDIPTAATIGGDYIYRATGIDVPLTDGGTGASSA